MACTEDNTQNPFFWPRKQGLSNKGFAYTPGFTVLKTAQDLSFTTIVLNNNVLRSCHMNSVKITFPFNF